MKVANVVKKSGQVFTSSDGFVFEDIPDPPAVAKFNAKMDAIAKSLSDEDLLAIHNELRNSCGMSSITMKEFKE